MEGTRIKCTLNGHCIPLESIGMLERLVGGKKFKKLASQRQDEQELQKFEPFLLPSSRLKGHLFCALTGQLIKTTPEAARKHMKGQRFLKAKERFMEDDMDLLEEPEAEAKPERRANHRLQRSSDPDAELRAPGEADGDADSSADVMGGSSDGEGHAAMDQLLESDDLMASEGSQGADDDDVAAEGAVDGAGGDRGSLQQLSGQGKRKRAGPGDAGGGGEAGTGKTKNKKSRVDLSLAKLAVRGSKQACSGKKGSKKMGSGGKNGSKKAGGDATGLKQVVGEKGGTGGKKVKERVKKRNATNGEVMSERVVDKAPAVSDKVKTASAKETKVGVYHGLVNASTGGSELGKSEVAAGIHQETAVSVAGASKSQTKGIKGRLGKG